jgi:hypothetical protein
MTVELILTGRGRLDPVVLPLVTPMCTTTLIPVVSPICSGSSIVERQRQRFLLRA